MRPFERGKSDEMKYSFLCFDEDLEVKILKEGRIVLKTHWGRMAQMCEGVH